MIYARVSARNRKDDLQNQLAFLWQFCNARGVIVDRCIEDCGSRLNYNHKSKNWNELPEMVMEQKAKTICITHKDRFIRFGHHWFERFCIRIDAEIVAG